jgi:hypothetical protein
LTACLDALGRFAAKDRGRLDPAELLADLDLLVEIGQRAEALGSVLAAQATARGAGLRAEALDIASHLRLAHHLPGGQAKRLEAQGEALRAVPVIAKAAGLGQIALTQALTCAKQLADFPVDQLGDQALTRAQDALVPKAATLGVKGLEEEARKAVDRARAEAGIGGDRADRLERERARARRERFLSFRREGAAMKISGSCPIEVGVKIQARVTGAAQAVRRAGADSANGGGNPWTLSPVAETGRPGAPFARGALGDAPPGAAAARPAGIPPAGVALGDPVWDGPARAGRARWSPAPEPTPAGGDDCEPFAASMLDALVAIIDHLPAGTAPLSVGKPARLVVATTLDQLASTAPRAVLRETDEAVAPSVAREESCDSELVRIVVGQAGEVLDVGQSTRRIPKALRIALAERDRGCAFPSCAMPPSACQAHHLWKYKNGCPTSLEGLVLVCVKHHAMVEPTAKLADGTRWRPGMDNPDRWRIEIDPVLLHPVAIPPARVDPDRRPLLNDRIATKLRALGVIDENGRPTSPPPGPPPAAKTLPSSGRTGLASNPAAPGAGPRDGDPNRSAGGEPKPATPGRWPGLAEFGRRRPAQVELTRQPPVEGDTVPHETLSRGSANE